MFTENEDLNIELSASEKLLKRFESILRLYKYVVENPKHFDRSFHLREIEYATKAISEFKKEIKDENSNN